MIYLDTINILVSFAALFNVIYGGIVFAHDPKDNVNRRLFLLTVVASTWGLLMVIFRIYAFIDVNNTLPARALYVVAAMIPSVFLYMIIALAKVDIKSVVINAILIIVPVIVTVLLFIPNLLIQGLVVTTSIDEPIIIFNDVAHLIYAGYVSSMFTLSFALLLNLYKTITNKKIMRQVFYLMVGALIATTISFITNLVMPTFGYFDFNWVGQVSIAFMAAFITYGIYKESIFSTKIAITEMAVAVSGVMIFINILLSNTLTARLFGLVTLILFSILGYIIILTIGKEVHTKEVLAHSAERLKKLNKKLIQFDKKKTEFLHIATHQLRGPVAAVRGYISLIDDGEYGKVGKNITKPLDKIRRANDTMSDLVDDYLRVAQIDDGTLQIHKEAFKLCDIVKAKAESSAVLATQKGVALTLKKATDGKCKVYADKRSITQVVSAVFENAVKYTNKGSITIHTEKAVNKKGKKIARLFITDTGMGIASEDMSTLFNKFSRGTNAKSADIFGTGMGLFLAKSLVEINDGTISIDSDGVGKGTTVVIELPLVS